jgi:hypothetical protein
MRAPGDSIAAFLGWCLAGAGLCLGVLTILTVGPFLLLFALFLCALLVWRPGFGWGIAGLLSGAAAPLLYVAWLNRGGPGQVCTGNSRAITCTDEWSPWPFVAAGVLLVGAGLGIFLTRRDRF